MDGHRRRTVQRIVSGSQQVNSLNRRSTMHSRSHSSYSQRARKVEEVYQVPGGDTWSDLGANSDRLYNF